MTIKVYLLWNAAVFQNNVDSGILDKRPLQNVMLRNTHKLDHNKFYCLPYADVKEIHKNRAQFCAKFLLRILY